MIKFPQSFTKSKHKTISDCNSWIYSNGKDLICVIGGSSPEVEGDGITTFGIWDKRLSDPMENITVDDINSYLNIEYN